MKLINSLGGLALAFVFLVVFGCVGCKTEKPQEEEDKKVPRKEVNVPRFTQDSAYAFIEKQVSFGPRVPGTDPHQACKEWLVAKFKSYGAKVTEQDFTANIYTGEKWPSTNIIAAFNPEHKRRVMLSAHWDSRFMADQDPDDTRKEDAILGADDGGSGVGVLLEIARTISENPIDLGVDIILFDAEDQGFDAQRPEDVNSESWCLGAQHWARNIHVANYNPSFGILLDMVGSKGARFPKEGYSMQFARNLVNKVWKLAQSMGYGNFFVNERAGGITDDHYFVNTVAGIKMINIINKPPGSRTGFGPYWHTHDDNMEVINKRTLRAVGQLVTAVIYNESGGTF